MLRRILRLLMLTLPVALLAACQAPLPDLGPAITEPLERRQPGLAAPSPSPLPGAVLATLTTEQQLAQVTAPVRNLRDLAMRLHPELGEIPIVVSQQAPGYVLGDEAPFWVHNMSSSTNTLVTATLAYSTPVAYAWVERDQQYDQAAIARSIDRFTQITYPRAVATFGSEWYPGIDGDPRLHILYSTALGGGIAGYFYASDAYSRLASPYSNEREMFYINLDLLNRTQNYAYHDTTLAHELQHMIHWHQDQGEDLWINEGLSEYAQEVAALGNDTMFVAAFAAAPDLQLTTWGLGPNSNGAHYGSAYLFVAYLAQRFGQEIISTLVAERANGLAGVEAALRTAGVDMTAADLFADWVVANYAQDADALVADRRYGYGDYDDLPVFAPAATHTEYPVPAQAAEVFNFGTDYLQVLGEGDVHFQFQGDVDARLAPTAAPGGDRAWWSNRADDANPHLAQRIDLSDVAAGTPVTLTASMWWEIEEGYDYGYVLASRDGAHWALLPGQHTRTAGTTGTALGPGYTGQSGGDGAPAWLEEHFDLSAYAGAPVWVQFSYVLDDAVNATGWLVDDLRLACGTPCPAVDEAGWESEGWLYTDNHLPQRWLVQVLEFQDDRLTAVRRLPVGADGWAEATIDDLGNGRHAVIAISGLTPVTTLPARYSYTIDRQD